MRRFILFSWLFMVLVVSLIPTPETGLETIGIDKLVHFFIYGITAVLFLRFYDEVRPQYRFAGLLAVLSAFSYGLIIELIQAVIPYRSFSALDIVANLSGATFFVFFGKFFRFNR